MFPLLFIITYVLALSAPATSTTAGRTATFAAKSYHNRRILHQPLFPLDQPISPALPPTSYHHSQHSFSSPQPQPQPNYPFSSLSPPSTTQTQNPFFPFFEASPPPPPPPAPVLATFPANISSLILPHSSSSSGNRISRKLVVVIVSVSLLSAAVIAGIAGCLLQSHRYHQHHQHYSKADSLRLFPPNTIPSDSTATTILKKSPARPPPSLPRHTASSSSSEFLYLGTLVSSRDANGEVTDAAQSSKNPNATVPSVSASLHYQRLGSPELHPLPPLPRHHFPQSYKNSKMGSDEEEEFFSPRDSAGDKSSSEQLGSGSQRAFQEEKFRSRSTNSFHYSNSNSLNQSSSSSPSIVLNLSPRSSVRSQLPDSLVNFQAPPRIIPPPPSQERRTPSSSPPSSGNTQNSPSRASEISGNNSTSPGQNLGISAQFVGVRMPPPPPPLPPPRFWDTTVVSVEPSVLVAPSRQVVGLDVASAPANSENLGGKNENGAKPKLKPLHWDKVRAGSDQAMVWDQLKSGSFQLNEEMIETLFMVNSSNSNWRDTTRRPIMPDHDNQVLDPKKSQNIAILLRALNVTIHEVCEALLEGNADMLGTELLESLLKMAPTYEEEQKLKDFKDESPCKLGPAEKFLKSVLNVPHAFRRVDAMLYMANFDSEVEYLKRSFETLEEACKELRNSRMFLKLLEAVLKTGNRMNDGTNRGDAHAFKLDTLLKLVDVKGTDGKTTLLHFVVHEIIRAEGSRLVGSDQNATAESNEQFGLQNEAEVGKIGLQVVSGLSGELSNVKKAAAMDSDVLGTDVVKLTSGITKVVEILKLNEELGSKDSSQKFSEAMNEFLKKAEEEIIKIQGQESMALSMVKELTGYFHGNSVKEEAHPFRIFMVVRDFLHILDQVCKDVGKMNDRTIVSSGRQFSGRVNSNVLPVFSAFDGKQQCVSFDNESSALS